ncbi:hypothetical protein E2C01_031049 [Portunus trituberculatus]|uniref:Uncharacterized protein n=1 Tax=Portunus trituberculatus TaxID=210409 RepID=A0A5B7EXI7_PORTR|nr:hypothetical protein [Portunus trituberculatus]
MNSPNDAEPHERSTVVEHTKQNEKERYPKRNAGAILKPAQTGLPLPPSTLPLPSRPRNSTQKDIVRFARPLARSLACQLEPDHQTSRPRARPLVTQPPVTVTNRACVWGGRVVILMR